VAKSKWDSVKDKLVLVEAWARDGCTDDVIAQKLGISKDTFYKYKIAHTDFSDSLKRGKEIVDIEVENALLKRAKGFEYTETKIEESPKDGRKVTITKKFIPPDTTAQIFWLKNRKPEQWRDKQPEQQGVDGEEDDNLYNAITEAVKKL